MYRSFHCSYLFALSPIFVVALLPPSEASPRSCAISGGNPPRDRQNFPWAWREAGFEPGTAGLVKSATMSHTVAKTPGFLDVADQTLPVTEYSKKDH